ncbi:MAG TPA: hypothetical protein VNL77_20020 [Roseiflexaceae bacterium]|nr:hypothetical protein [Roseiflexaceae bacterium]
MIRRFVLFGLLALTWALWLPAAPAAAQESVAALPAVASFRSARFDILTTVETGGARQVAYGKGAVVLPDRAQVWLVPPPNNQIISVVQIGGTIYINTGSGWQRSEGLPLANLQSQPVAEQFAQLQRGANGILRMGDAQVRGVPVTHYQLWLGGDAVLAAGGEALQGLDSQLRDLIAASTYKYDLWIGRDGRLHQQNTVAMVPASEINGTPVPASTTSTLITYYDFDDAGIAITAPQ